MKLSKKAMKSINDFVCFVCLGNFDALKKDQQYKLPMLVDLHEYLLEGLKLPITPVEVVHLEEIVKELTEFKRAVFEFLRKDYSKESNSLKELLRCVIGLDVIIEPEISQLKKRAKSLIETSSKDKSPDKEEGPRYCICREVYVSDKPMIGCDQCSEWYHWDCLDLSAKDVEAMRDSGFVCTVCRPDSLLNCKIEQDNVLNNHGNDKVVSLDDLSTITLVENSKFPMKDSVGECQIVATCTNDLPIHIKKVL